VERPPPSGGSRRGFTLLELTAGLAVTALLVLSVLQVVFRFTGMGDRMGEVARDRHRRAVLARLLWEDLNHLPVGDPAVEGDARHFERTTVSYESDRLLRLDTRVRYTIRERGGRQVLRRSWRWVGLQEEFQEPRTLLRAPRIRFSYRGPDGRWFSDVRTPGELTAVRLAWGEDRRLVVPGLEGRGRNVRAPGAPGE